jgi:hypothetical protein
MNEKLKELMLAAGYAAPEMAGRGQKLAELIVKECAGILEPKSRYMGEGPEVLKDKITQIKKHFGVE